MGLARDAREHCCDCGFGWVRGCCSAKVGQDLVRTHRLDRRIDPSDIAD
jgi:hypothetical protein